MSLSKLCSVAGANAYLRIVEFLGAPIFLSAKVQAVMPPVPSPLQKSAARLYGSLLVER